jgi:hypothetical protein
MADRYFYAVISSFMASHTIPDDILIGGFERR